MKQEILIKKKNKIYATFSENSPVNKQLAASFNYELMSYGYMLTQNAFEYMSMLSNEDVSTLYNDVLPTLAKMRGAHVRHKPMYKGFPKEVMDKSHFELYVDWVLYYWTHGRWNVSKRDIVREVSFEPVDYVLLDIGGELELTRWLNDTISSKESISETDKEYIRYLIKEDYAVRATIEYKEILVFVAGVFFDLNKDITPILTTATDVLRFITYLSGGDISLSKNCKFKSLNRPTRKKLVMLLDKVVNEDDIAKHGNKWKRAFHMLHVGDYAKKCKHVYAIAQKLRNGKLSTFNSMVNKLLNQDKITTVLSLLSDRPGELHRRMDFLLRKFKKNETEILDSYKKVVGVIPTRLLIQMRSHLKSRKYGYDKRVVMPKGMTQKAILLPKPDKTPSKKAIDILDAICNIQMVKNFNTLPPLGAVYIDEDLKYCPLPTQQRSASDCLVEMARGTKFSIGNKEFLRFFVYWVGKDIDLSATLHNEKFEAVSNVSWTNLKGTGITHSGDIRHAPYGATEFIDMNIDVMLERNIRYVCMNVFVFDGGDFKNHKEVFAGWMTINHDQRNEIFQPTQVKQKVDLKGETTFCVPVVIDLLERKAVWVDIQNKSAFNRNRMVETNKLQIEDILKIACIKSDISYNLQDLFRDHVVGRGLLVDDPTQADIKFGMDRETCDVTPFDINIINSQYL